MSEEEIKKKRIPWSRDIYHVVKTVLNEEAFKKYLDIYLIKYSIVNEKLEINFNLKEKQIIFTNEKISQWINHTFKEYEKIKL